MVMEGEFFLFNLPYLLHDFYKALFLVLACFFPSVFLLVALQFLVFSVCLWDFDGYRLFGEYVFSPFFWPVWAFFFLEPVWVWPGPFGILLLYFVFWGRAKFYWLSSWLIKLFTHLIFFSVLLSTTFYCKEFVSVY